MLSLDLYVWWGRYYDCSFCCGLQGYDTAVRHLEEFTASSLRVEQPGPQEYGAFLQATPHN